MLGPFFHVYEYIFVTVLIFVLRQRASLQAGGRRTQDRGGARLGAGNRGPPNGGRGRGRAPRRDPLRPRVLGGLLRLF